MHSSAVPRRSTLRKLPAKVDAAVAVYLSLIALLCSCSCVLANTTREEYVPATQISIELYVCK
jgi:hypothetical protein